MKIILPNNPRLYATSDLVGICIIVGFILFSGKTPFGGFDYAIIWFLLNTLLIFVEGVLTVASGISIAAT